MTPKFIHPESWRNFDTAKTEFALDGKRRLYEAHVYPEFSIATSDGNQYRPAMDKFLHNFGTIPSLAQIIPALQKDRWRIGYAWHDNLVEFLKIKRLSQDKEHWLVETITRPWADRFLCFELGVAEKAWLSTRLVVYGGVSAGTGWSIIRRILDRGSRKRVRP